MNKAPLIHDLETYVTHGFQLIPLQKWDAVDSRGRPRGKTPRDGAWQVKDYDSAAVLKIAASSGINVGVRLPDTIMVLDVDPRNFPEGRDSLAELVADARLDLSIAPHVITGSGGHHYYFMKPAGVSLMDSLDDYQGIEFKSLGRQVVAAGSVHPNGNHYMWDDFAPLLSNIPMMPESLLLLTRRPTRAHGDAAGLGDLTPDQLAATLEFLNAEDFKEESHWRDLMMACHHATNGEGRQEFIEWSTQDADYQDDAWIIGRRWDSLHSTAGRGGRPVTIKFLHKVVQEAGGEVARPNPEDEFDPWLEEDLGEFVDDERERKEPVLTGLAAEIEKLNEKHCVVFEDGKFRIFTEQKDSVLNRMYFQRSTKEDFENWYANKLVDNPNGEGALKLSSLWLRSAHRRQYEDVVFDPSCRADPKRLNLWRGWAVEPKRGDWGLLKQLILEVLVDGHVDHYEYVMNWMAYMIQYPDRMAEVAICFKGEKGTGKGSLGRALANLAGAHGLPISSPEHLTGRFNSHLRNCICLFADEAFWAGDKGGESKLKQLVTEPTITYEAKGKDAKPDRNRIHIIMASNSDWVVPAGLDGERRFAVFQVNNKRQGDSAFFGALNKQLETGGLEAMLHELLIRDLKGWAPRQNIPVTDALVEQKYMSMDDVSRWWYNRLLDGFLPNSRGNWSTEPIVILKEHLRNDYTEFSKEQRAYRPADPVYFGRRLNALLGGTLKNCQVKPDDTEYMVRVDAKGRASAHTLPSLPECRVWMEQKLGGPVEWPLVDD